MQRENILYTTERKLVTTKTIFTITIVVVILTIVCIWLFGLGKHRTIFENSLLSTSILSIVFFLFISAGLYQGIKLKDDIGKLTDKLNPSKFPNLSNSLHGTEITPVGDGILGIVISIGLWLVMTVLITLFIWLFGAVLWTGVIVFVAMLYWVFFRALRMVFKNSNKCKDNLTSSIMYGIAYTALYTFWIYGIIFYTSYLAK
jgi:heme O synthase-like polyprenyltransferase